MKDETGNGLTRMDDPFCVLPRDADDYIIMVENIDGVRQVSHDGIIAKGAGE